MLSTKNIFIAAIFVILLAILNYYVGQVKYEYYGLLILIFYIAFKVDNLRDNLYEKINSLNSEIQDIKNSVDVEWFSEFKHKTIERDVEQIQEKISILESDSKEIKTIVEEENEEKIKKQKEVSSYICMVSFEIDSDFVYKEMRLAGYDPENDFDFNKSFGFPHFQHIKDFVSGLEFMSIGGTICPVDASWSPLGLYLGTILCSWPRFKDGVIKNKFPNKCNKPLASSLFDDKYFITVGVREGKIQFLQFDIDENAQYDNLKVIGTFPYFNFIRELINLHLKVFAGKIKDNDVIKFEKEILSKSDFKEWKLEERIEFGWPGKSFYGDHDERPLHDFRFKSAYAWIRLNFEPNTRL